MKNHRLIGERAAESYLGATQQERATLGYKVCKGITAAIVGSGICFALLFGIGFAQGTIEAVRNWSNLEKISQAAEPNDANQLDYSIYRAPFHGDYRRVR